MSLLRIITTAPDAEEAAAEKYAALAGRTADPHGNTLLRRLTEKERGHRRVLRPTGA